MIAVLVAAGCLVAVAGWLMHQAREERLAGAQERREAMRSVEKIVAQAHEERRDLMDRLMHFAGKTWTLPPEPRMPDDATDRALESIFAGIPSTVIVDAENGLPEFHGNGTGGI